jgi:hypothetical protein
MTDRLEQVQPFLVSVPDVAENTDATKSINLWGAGHRDRTIASGLFVCPAEGVERAYWAHRIRNWFHVLGLPTVPGAIVGDYVECFACGSSFDPRVVAVRHPSLGNLRLHR